VINVTCEKSHFAAIPDYQLENQVLAGLLVRDITGILLANY
jgi:hypothetical protein